MLFLIVFVLVTVDMHCMAIYRYVCTLLLLWVITCHNIHDLDDINVPLLFKQCRVQGGLHESHWPMWLRIISAFSFMIFECYSVQASTEVIKLWATNQTTSYETLRWAELALEPLVELNKHNKQTAVYIGFFFLLHMSMQHLELVIWWLERFFNRNLTKPNARNLNIHSLSVLNTFKFGWSYRQSS